MPRSCSPSNGYFVSCECYPDKEALRGLSARLSSPCPPADWAPSNQTGCVLHLQPFTRLLEAPPPVLISDRCAPFPQAPPQHTCSTPNMTPPTEEAKRVSPPGPHLHLPQVSLGGWASPSPATWSTGHSRWKHRPQGPSPRQAPTPALSQGPEK